MSSNISSGTESNDSGPRRPRSWAPAFTALALVLVALVGLALVTHAPLILIAEALAVVVSSVTALAKRWR